MFLVQFFFHSHDFSVRPGMAVMAAQDPLVDLATAKRKLVPAVPRVNGSNPSSKLHPLSDLSNSNSNHGDNSLSSQLPGLNSPEGNSLHRGDSNSSSQEGPSSKASPSP